MRSLLSVASLFGRLPHSFKALLKLSGDILQDDLDKTIVAYVLGAARPRGRAPRTEGRAGGHSQQRNHSRVTLEPNSPPSEVWAWSILKAERPGFEGRAQTKPKSGTRKSKAAATKSNPAQRNPNCFSFPESRLSTGYRRFRRPFASYDIRAAGPPNSESSARATDDWFSEVAHQFAPLARKCRIPE